MKVCGILSGTSVDGISACIVDITQDHESNYKVELIEFVCAPWPEHEKTEIFQLMTSHQLNAKHFCQTNFMIGSRFAKVILDLKNLKDVELIGSHGQTIWHEIERGKCTSTLQLGESAEIALKTGITTISDFRVGDVVVGGQGAPLISIFDYLILRHPTKWRAIQNIGGIGNVTFVPPKTSNADVISFDTGPGNVLLDEIVRIVSDGKLEFDKDGMIAKSGKVNLEMLQNLMDHPYQMQKPPKTTGRELFGPKFAKKIYTEAKLIGLSDQDIISTVLQFTVDTIMYSYLNYGPPKLDEIIVSGGGKLNVEMMSRLSKRIQEVHIDAVLMGHEDLEELGMNPQNSDAKEAMMFAFLAYLNEKKQFSNIRSVTGASKRIVLGKRTEGIQSE